MLDRLVVGLVTVGKVEGEDQQEGEGVEGKGLQKLICYHVF